jgi:hypothetical protein
VAEWEQGKDLELGEQLAVRTFDPALRQREVV